MKKSKIFSPILKENLDIDLFVKNDTFRNLNKPVMLAFGYVNDANKHLFGSADYKEVEKLDNSNAQELTIVLQKAGFKVAHYAQEEASDPSYIVVTKTGIQTPFYQPKNAPEYARELLKAIIESNEAIPLSFTWAVRPDQLTNPKPVEFRSVLGKNFAHPDPRKFDEIMNRQGEDFFAIMLEYAYGKGTTNILEDYGFFIQKTKSSAYNGRPTADSQVIFAKNNLEARHIVYGTLDVETAQNYALMGNDRRGDAYEYNHSFGFLHTYKMIGDWALYNIGSLETAGGMQFLPKSLKDFEFPVGCGNSQYTGTFVCVDDRAFLIQRDNEHWKDFIELSRVSYIDDREKMNLRRENLIIEQIKEHGEVTTYDLQGNVEKSQEQIRKRSNEVRNKLKKNATQNTPTSKELGTPKTSKVNKPIKTSQNQR